MVLAWKRPLWLPAMLESLNRHILGELNSTCIWEDYRRNIGETYHCISTHCHCYLTNPWTRAWHDRLFSYIDISYINLQNTCCTTLFVIVSSLIHCFLHGLKWQNISSNNLSLPLVPPFISNVHASPSASGGSLQGRRSIGGATSLCMRWMDATTRWGKPLLLCWKIKAINLTVQPWPDLYFIVSTIS